MLVSATMMTQTSLPLAADHMATEIRITETHHRGQDAATATLMPLPVRARRAGDRTRDIDERAHEGRSKVSVANENHTWAAGSTTVQRSAPMTATVTKLRRMAYAEAKGAETMFAPPRIAMTNEGGPPVLADADPGAPSEWRRRWRAPCPSPLTDGSARHPILGPLAPLGLVPRTIMSNLTMAGTVTGYVSSRETARDGER